jgi:hypothetical protein
LGQPVDRRAQVGVGGAQPAGGAGLALQGGLLGLLEGRPGLQQLGHGTGGDLGKLVGRPRADRGSPQGRDPAGAVAVADGAELAGERSWAATNWSSGSRYRARHAIVGVVDRCRLAAWAARRVQKPGRVR